MNDNSAKQALEALDWDVQPERDLWPDIHSNIRFSGKPEVMPETNEDHAVASSTSKARSVPWGPMSLAACMLMAFGAFVMSAMSFQRSQATYELQASYVEFQKSQISLIDQQHAHVRAQFVDMLAGEHGPIDPGVAAEVRSVLLTIDQASLELKQAILAEPTNKNYSTMLARTYQQELNMLNKFKKQGGSPSREVSL
ncbi:hypothetical protein [Arenicella xantha]|nr:hypothetical protein [Arenicella xantha]